MRHGPILAGFLLALAGISALARDDHEPNNTPAQATSVKSGAVLQASIHPVKDVDHFVITVPEPGIGYLDVTVRDVPAAIAPLVQILGPDGKELDKAQRPSAAPLFHRILLEAAGKHTIVLRDGQGNWQDKLDDKASEDLLSVEVRFTPISQAFEPNNALAQAKALPLRKAVQATLFPKDDVDYYTVTVPEPGHGLITIRLSDIPEAMNPGIWALDAKGKVKENRWQQRVSGEVVLPIHVRAPGSLTFVVGTRRPDSGSGYYYSRRHASLSLYTLRVDYAPARDAAEPNDEAKTATPLPLGEAKAAVLFPAGDVDAYTIDIPAPGRLDVTLTRVDDSIAPRLTLFGPDGKAIDRAQRAQGAELHTQRELAAPGAYVLHVQDGAVSAHGYSDREHDGYALAPYTLRAVFTPAPDANEPNGSHDTAKAVARDTAVQAAIFPVGDTDFYKFTVPPKTRGVARIRVAGLNDKLVPRIRLFDGAKREIQKAVGGRERAAVLTRGLVAGDYFVQVHDSDFHNGAGWERANDSSSVEAYSFVVAFEPVPHAQAEPNDTFEQAEPIVFGQERQASIFPAGDGDIYKVEIAEAGPIRIRVGDFMSDIRARLNLYGPDKKLMLALDRHAPRAILDAEIKKPGAYYVQVHPVSFSRGGHSFSAGAQFDVAPYSVLVSRLASPAAGAAEREPNDAMAAAQPIRPGQTLTCRIDKARDRDWFAFALDAPAHVDIELLHAPPELDLIVDVFRRAPGTQLPEKNVLYLTGHREYNLHDHFPDIRFTAFGSTSAEAKAAFANPALMSKYDAIVVDCLHDPKQIDLDSPRVQANIQAYVQGGGRFMMFAPVFALEHFGLEGVAPGWDEGAVVDLGVKHPLLQEGVERRVRGWRGSESGGHLKGWRASGYQMLFAHASDPERHAVTVAKKIGAGYLIVDTQTVGYYLHWPVADWKFRSYLGVPQVTHVGRFTDTLRPRGLGAAGAKERARIRAWEPGTYFISIHDPNASRKSDKPYTLSVAVTPIVAPPPAVSALAAAKPITLDAAGKAAESLTLSGTRQRAWFRVQGKASATLSVALGNVPPNVDPQITVYESVDPKADLTKPKRALYLHGNRADLNLDRHAPGVAFERIEWNDARAPAILLRPENLAGYAAVVVEGMTRPEDFGLNLAAAAAAVEAYAAKGGRFIVLAPQCKATLFGVENADWGGWHQDAVREVYPGHPLLAARTREQTLAGWPGHESVGYWIRERDSAFQPLLVDWRDIHRYVVTLARQVGTGYIILDTQPLGQAPNADAATWKLHAYLGQQPVLRRVEVANDTEGGGLGAGERLTLQTRPTPYIIEVANRLPSASLRPMSLEFAMAAPDRPLEPDDTPATAKVADAGQTLQATLDPGGDADWRAVTAPERGVLSLRVTDLADNVDPVLAVRRPPSADKALRVLYLEGDPKNAIDEDRFAGVAITRIDAFEPRAAKALDLLAEHDMAILSSLSDARQFGLAQPASHEKLRRFVEAGGRCVVLRPFGLSFAENNPQMGGRFLGASSQWDAGVWHGAHASDGYKVPGARGYTWCCGNGAKFPHTLTWALAPTARRIDRLVLYSHTTTAKARPKKIEVRVGADPKALKSVGTFVAADSDARQVFRFPPVDCSVAQLVITENYGHTKETQLGEVEFYGPDSMVGFFGVPFEAGPRGNTTVVADPMHWLLRRRAGGRLSGWGAAENAGYWSGWREKGFHLVCADRADVRRYGATLFRRLGKGSVVLDAQSLAHAPFAPHAAWRLHNLFDAGSDVMGRFDATQAQTHGADETVDLPLTEKSSLLVGVEDNAATGNVSNRSARAYRFTAAFRPEGSEVEPNDLPARAVRLMLGEAVEDALFPGGDVDWYTVAVERPATVSVRVDGVPANLDPVVEVHRADLRGKPVKALLLACQPDTNIDRRIWGPAPVTFTRIDAGTPAEATALENLGAYDVVLLDRPDTARRFGLDRKENWAAIEKYAEGGGRFIVLGPRGASFSLLGGGAGARATAWSAGVGGLDDAYRLCDGVWHPNSTGGAWASRYKAKPPHWVVFRLAGAKPVPIDRMVLCVSASTPARCAKDIELQVAQDDDATTFTSVGKWTCPAEGGRQTLRFDATTARLVKFIVHANHGDPNYTNIGNIELYGPGQPEGLFGVPHIDSGVDSIAPAGETHWITARKPEKQSWGRLGTRGYFVAWDGSGFEPVLVDKAAAGKRAVTLCKTVGKGAIVLDAQDLGAPGRDRDAAWKLQTYLGVAPTLVAEFNNTLGMGKGGGEHFAFDAAPALYYLRLGDWQVERQRARGTLDPSPGAPWSLDKLRLLVTLGESDRPFEPNDTPERATALASGLPVKSTLFPAGDVDWFRVSLAKPTSLTVELVDVAADLDPAMELYAAGEFDRALGRFDSTQRGGDGCPEMFVFTPKAAGDYYIKVLSSGRTVSLSSPRAFTLRARFDDAKKAEPPAVVALWPPTGLRSASLSPEIVVQFDRPMAERGMDSSITVRGAKSGAHRVTVKYDPTRCLATVASGKPFHPSEAVTVTVGAGLASEAGGKLAADRTSTFTTMSPLAGGKPAVVRIALSPVAPLGVGEATVTLTPSRRLRGTPELIASVGGAALPVAGLAQDERGQWTAHLTVPKGAANGEGSFTFRGVDSRGLPVSEVAEGRTFLVDTQPPPAMAALTAAPAPGGAARLTWQRPAGIADLGGYRLYRSARDSNRVADATVVKTITGADFLTWDDPTPKDGAWRYFIAAVDRAGNVGAPSATTAVTTDRVGPRTAIGGVVAEVVKKPRVDVRWQATAEADVVGYSIFRFVKTEGAALPALADSEPLTEAPRDRTSLEDFPKDALYIYIVAARDAAGNLGPPSAPAEVVADTRQAHATFVIPGDQPLTQGDHALTVTLTEPLGSDLKLALRFPRGVVRELQPTKKDALTYEATLTFTEKDPDCRVYLKVDGEDRYGNKGIRIVRGSSFTIDTGPPRSRVTTTPPGRVPLGAVPVRVEFFEGVKDGAALWYTIDGKRVDVPIKRQRDQVFVGQLALTADSPNGVAEFHTSATDSHGHAGGAVVEGKAFTIDTRAPEPPLNMTVRPGPVRALLLTWSRPTAEPVDHFRLYAAPTQDVKPGKDTLRAERVRDTKATHKLGENEILWFVVTAVDRAGNESGPSKAVKGVPDVTAPPPPTALRVVLGHDLRVRLAWTAPQADEPVRYHVYRLDKPAQGVAGHKPVLEVDAAEAIDVPKKDGLYHYLVTAVDEAGNASAPAAAEPFDFDVNAPTATVALAPTEGTRGYRESYYVHYDIGVLAAGEKAVTLSPSEPLSEAPTLRYRTRTMDTPRELALQQAAPPSAAAPGGAWTGAIAIPEKTDDGKLLFLFQGTDRKGNRGDVIPRGKGNVLWIDTTRPEAVQPLEAASLPVGKVALTWSRPPREGSGDVKYFVYRASEPFEQLGDLKPIKAGLDRPAYTDEPTEDGTYHYAVIAVDRAGNVGKLHRSVAAASDGTPPAAPTDVKAAVKGRLTLSWQAPADEALVFRVLRGDIVAAEGLRERTFVDAPDEDGDYAYRVIAVDGAGNESAPSSQAKVAFVNTLPVATITTEPASPARSTFRVVVASSQTLKAPPDLFIHFARGKPVRVPCVPRDGKFVGSVQVTKDTPNGPARFTFRATSAAGHVGDGIRSGAAVVIDTRPPSAKLALSPPSPLKAGTVRLTLTPSEPLADMPKLAYTTMGAQARTVALTAKDKGYVAEIEITADDEDGIGFLSFSGIDKAGNTGTRLGGERFAIDSHPPKAPTALAAAPQARGRVELTWTPPAYSARETADAVAGYNIYASADDITERGTLEPILRLARRMPIQVTPPADGKLFFAVTTVDTAGHESAPSKSATCVVDRTPPAPPTVRAQAAPGSIELSWDAAEDAVAFHVLVLAPGERDWRRVAEKIDEKAFSYRPLQGGRYAVRVQAVDAQGQVSLPSKAVPVEFVQNAPLARIQGIGKRLGAGAFPVAMETTRPLVRPPTLRLVPEGGAPIAIPMQGAGNTWRGVLTVVKAEKGGPARLEFEGVAQVGGQEVTGRSILTATDVALDFEPPTVAVEFVERTPSRERKSILKAGRHRFRVRASEPLRAAPVVDFTPRGKATQRAELVKQSDTVWAGVLVVDEKVGDGTGMFEVTAVDTQGNTGDAITVNRVVDIDTTPPEAVSRLRAVPLPRGKVRCDWTAPTLEDGSLDKEANTFYMYRNESEIKDVTGRDPHRVIQKVLGMVDFPSADRDYFYALAAVDRAGNVGALSANAKVHVDKVAPGKPLEFRVNQTQTGVVHLSWKPPEGEKALFYNVYLAKHPILTTEGLTPRNPGVTWTEIYGTPKENGLYYFAVTAVDAALNEGEPCESVLLDYKTIAPYAQFFLEPDIWLRNGDYKATLRTSKDLVEPPTVTIHTAEEKTIPLVFEGDGSLWRATVTIDDSYREGTYGLRFHGKDAEGNVGDEVQRGPLFHVDKTAPESPGELKIKPDDRGTPGAVFLEWVTPKRADAQTEVPHFYNIYRSETRIESLDGLAPIHTKKVKFENIDNYDYTDKPPANGTYFYAVTSLDMARNESGPSNVFEVTVQSDSPRATLDYAYVADGKTSPVARDEEGLPVFGKGVVRVTLTATSPLAAAPKLAWHPKRQEDQLHPIALTGEGSTWQGDFQVELDAEGTQTAILVFEGTSVGGTKGTFIRQGGAVRLDGEGPEAEIIIPDAYRMLVNVKTNELEAPPVHGGRVALTLTTKEDLARAPALSYTFGDGKKIPVPVAGFGREWRGWMDIPLDADGLEGTYQYEGVDRAGNASTAIAKRRYPYDVDDTVIPPRKIANYATTGGKFRADASAPDAPSDIETEMRKLGVAVIKWKEPDGEPWTYNLYRAYTPITSIDNLKPVATKIYATVMVDAPPVDGNYYYAVSAVDMAGNESPVSNSASVFIDTIKPELKIKAAPLGDDFVIFFDEDEPPELTLTINFPGQRPTTVELGGSSGKLEKYPVRTFPDGRRGFVLPEQAKFFNGRVEVIVHSPDPEGNRVEEKTEVEYKKIATATGGEVESADAQVQLVIPPGIIPQGPNEGKRIGGYENLFFIQYANIPDKKPTTEPGKKRRRDEVDPIRPGLEVIGVPYRIEMNQPPEEPIELKASSSQADFSQLAQFKRPMAKLKMAIPTQYSDVVEDADYLKKRLTVMKWAPARTDDEPGRWEPVPDIEVDVKNKQIIVPATDVTTYVIVSERTPPSIREMQPERDDVVVAVRPTISCLIVDKGTGVAIGAENRIVLSIDGKRIDEKLLEISKGDPTEVRVTYTPREDIAPGVHTVGVRAEDVVENVANVKWQFTIDNEPPEILAVLPRDGARLPVARPIIQARVEDVGGIDAARTELHVNGSRTRTAPPTWDEATGILTCALRDDLPGGAVQAELIVVDRAGKESRHAWAFQTDLEPPEAARMLPAPNSPVAPDTQRIELGLKDLFGRASVLELRVDGAVVQDKRRDNDRGFAFDGETGTLTYESPEPFALGERTVAAVFADDLGNSATRTWSFTVKEGAPPAAALEVAVATPAFETARSAHTARIEEVDLQHLAALAPKSAPEAARLLEEAEEAAVEGDFEASAAKYTAAAAKLDTAVTEAREAEKAGRSREAMEALAQAKADYRDQAADVDATRLQEHAPEAAARAAALAKEADALAAQGKPAESAAAYEKAKAELAAAEQKAREADPRAVTAALRARHRAAEERFVAQFAEAEQAGIGRYVPAEMQKVRALVVQAGALGRAGKIAESAQAYEEGIALLRTAKQKAADLVGAEATAGLKAKHAAAKKRYAALAAGVDRARITRHAPQELLAADQLAQAAVAAAVGGDLTASVARYGEAATKLAAADRTAQRVEAAALGAQFAEAKEAFNVLAAAVDLERIAKHAAQEYAAVGRLVNEGETLARQGRPTEGAAKIREATAKLGAVDRAAQAAEAAVVRTKQTQYAAAKKLYEERAAAMDVARIQRFAPQRIEKLRRLVREAGEAGAAGDFELGADRYGEAVAEGVAADQVARQLELAGKQRDEEARQAALLARLETARTRYTARAGKVDVQAVEKHVPGGAAAVSQLVRQAEALAEGGDPGGAAGKYAEAEAQLAGAAEMAERLALQAAQQAERAYRDTRDTVAKLLAATDRVRLERHAPGAVTSVLAIVRLADGYARKGEFPAAAAECAKAREFLADADRRAQRQASAAPPDVVTPPAGPIALEMAHIENLLKQRQTRTAVTRVTRNLFDLWKQRRTQWAELGQWVDQTGAKYPALLTVGRYRLPALKRQLKEYAAQEEKWQGTVKAVQATADLREKIAKLDQFLRYNYSSFYRVDAVALQDKIRDELARRRR